MPPRHLKIHLEDLITCQHKSEPIQGLQLSRTQPSTRPLMRLNKDATSCPTPCRPWFHQEFPNPNKHAFWMRGWTDLLLAYRNCPCGERRSTPSKDRPCLGVPLKPEESFSQVTHHVVVLFFFQLWLRGEFVLKDLRELIPRK